MNREQVEAEIRQLLVTETRTAVLSNKLFQQGTGLFRQLWDTPEEKQAVIHSALFKEAMERVRDLQYRDAGALREASKVVAEKLPGVDFRLTLDTSPRPS
ncbi:MAG TPA: hypothetical protein VMZ71_16940 [Gemmataceae bacterium]|nr:hypothetical protein [Gemmataceae bacterium]